MTVVLNKFTIEGFRARTV